MNGTTFKTALIALMVLLSFAVAPAAAAPTDTYDDGDEGLVVEIDWADDAGDTATVEVEDMDGLYEGSVEVNTTDSPTNYTVSYEELGIDPADGDELEAFTADGEVLSVESVQDLSEHEDVLGTGAGDHDDSLVFLGIGAIAVVGYFFVRS